MIIWGWGRQTAKDYGPTLYVECSNCGNSGYWRLERRATWFSLFFIPLIPYQWKHRLWCPICSRGVELTGEQADRAKRLAALTSQYISGVLPEADYARGLASHRILEIAARTDAEPPVPSADNIRDRVVVADDAGDARPSLPAERSEDKASVDEAPDLMAALKESVERARARSVVESGGTGIVVDEFVKLADLRARGILTDEEFAAKKKQMLGLPE